MLIEILFKMLLFKGGVLIYAEHCTYVRFQKNITNIQADKNFKHNGAEATFTLDLFSAYKTNSPRSASKGPIHKKIINKYNRDQKPYFLNQ